MKNVIYKIRNVVNEHYYIGSTVDSRKRFWSHRKDLRLGQHVCVHLQRAWNKYGEDCFKFEIVEQLDSREALLPAEQKWLDEHFGARYCYNSAAHADAPMRDASPEMRAHLAAKTKAWLEREGHPRQGHKCTPEEIAHSSANRKGKHAGPEHYRYGNVVSPEVRAKISATQKGRPNPRKGQKMSEQGRLNVAAAVKRGEESPFYGKRPVNADALQKQVYVLKPDGTQETYPSLTYMRDTLGISIATTIRACKSGNLVQMGVASGWRMSYEPLVTPDIPEEYAHLPRTRQLAKEQGAAQYFTGVPCERGHVGPRAVKGTCILCRREDDAAAYAKKKLAQTQNTMT